MNCAMCLWKPKILSLLDNFMLSKQQAEHIAKLARIQLSPEEIEKFQKDLGGVLEYFDVFKEVDVTGIDAMMHSVDLQNVTREDLPQPCSEKIVEQLLEAFPEKTGRYLKVKSIL